MGNTDNTVKNNEKIHISRVVLCEGKYDKIKLSSIIDGVIMTTDGFAIFNDREKQALLRKLCKERGALIITDSDRAGFFIRNKLKGYLDRADIKQIYIPQIKGRERRKTADSKDGLLGVEGINAQTLRKLLYDAGIDEDGNECDSVVPISKARLYSLGLSGGSGSSTLRKAVCLELGLPDRLSSNALAEACALLRIDEQKIEKAIEKIRKTEEASV